MGIAVIFMNRQKLLISALLGSIFVLALLLRAAVPEKPLRYDTDEGQYYRLGTNLLADGLMYEEFPESLSAFRMPLYPAFIAASLKAAGEGERGVARVQLLLNALAVFLIFYAGIRLHSAGCGLLAALLWAVNPAQVARTPYLYIESFYSFAVLAVISGLLYFLQKVSAKRAVLLGVLFGISFAARSTLFLLPPALSLVLLLKEEYRAFRLSLLSFAVALLLLAPWAARNYAFSGGFVPFEKNAALVNLYTAASGLDGIRPNDEVYARFLAAHPGLSPYGADARLRAEAKELILRDPAGFLRGCVRRFFKFAAMAGEAWGNYAFPFAFFSLAALLLSRGGTRTLLLFCFAGYFLAVHAPMSISPRYLYPLTPAAALLCAEGAALAWRRLSGRELLEWPEERARPWGIALGVSAVFLGLLYALTVAAAARETARARGYGEFTRGYYSAMEDFSQNRLAGAIAGFESLKGLKGSDRAMAKVLNDQGVAYLMAGRPREAAAGLEKAVGLYPRSVEARVNLYYADLRAGRKPEAREALSDGVAEIRKETLANGYDSCGEIGASLQLLAATGTTEPALLAVLKKTAAANCGPTPAP